MDPSKSGLDFCKFVSNVGLAAYFAFDQIMYLKKTSVLNLSDEQTLLFDRLTEGSWLIEIVFGLPAAFNKYAEHAAKERTLVAQVPTPAAELDKTRAGKNAALLEIIKLLSDAPIALHFLNLVGDTPHGLFGLLGVVSSLIGAWEVWPQM